MLSAVPPIPRLFSSPKNKICEEVCLWSRDLQIATQLHMSSARWIRHSPDYRCDNSMVSTRFIKIQKAATYVPGRKQDIVMRSHGRGKTKKATEGVFCYFAIVYKGDLLYVLETSSFISTVDTDFAKSSHELGDDCRLPLGKHRCHTLFGWYFSGPWPRSYMMIVFIIGAMMKDATIRSICSPQTQADVCRQCLQLWTCSTVVRRIAILTMIV